MRPRFSSYCWPRTCSFGESRSDNDCNCSFGESRSDNDCTCSFGESLGDKDRTCSFGESRGDKDDLVSCMVTKLRDYSFVASKGTQLGAYVVMELFV